MKPQEGSKVRQCFQSKPQLRVMLVTIPLFLLQAFWLFLCVFLFVCFVSFLATHGKAQGLLLFLCSGITPRDFGDPMGFRLLNLGQYARQTLYPLYYPSNPPPASFEDLVVQFFSYL